MNIVIMGPPGAGKGTQAQRLTRELGIPHIASGDLFRDVRDQDTPLALEIRGFMDRGEYVPDALTIDLVLRRLDAPDTASGFILDGFPRTTGQAEALDSELKASGRGIDVVLNIDAPDDILLPRLQNRVICPQCHTVYNLETNPPKNDMVCDVCGHTLERRTDETPEVVQHRIEVFYNQTKPVLEYYRRHGKVVDINGARGLNEVAADVDRVLQGEGLALQKPKS